MEAGGKVGRSYLPGNHDGYGLPLAAIGCLGVLLLAGGACTKNTLDLFDPDLGLLGHWALDESLPGSVAVDSSVFANPGHPSDNPPIPTGDTPPVHFADPFSLSFTGQNQWIDLGNPPLFNNGGPVSMSAWIRATAIDAGPRNIIAHGYRSSPDYDFALRIESGTYAFTMWDGPVNHRAQASIPSDDVGRWVHLCGVFDGTSYNLYRNGALAAAIADATVPPPSIDAGWAIGAHPLPSTTADRQFQGQIDDVRFYGRALLAAEVDALYRR
jgi:hypothetical protein